MFTALTKQIQSINTEEVLDACVLDSEEDDTLPSSSANPMAGDEANGGVTLLAAVEDKYGGVTLLMTEMSHPVDPSAFSAFLRSSLSNWTLQGKTGVWIKLPRQLIGLAETTVNEGFWFHHAEGNYLMLVYWIPKQDDTLLPAVDDKYAGVMTEMSHPMDPSARLDIPNHNREEPPQRQRSSPSLNVAPPRRPTNLENHVPEPHLMDRLSWTALGYCFAGGFEFNAILAQVENPNNVSIRVQLMSLLLQMALCLLIAANGIFARTHPKMALRMDRVGCVTVLISAIIAAIPTVPVYYSIGCAVFMVIVYYAHRCFF